MLSQTAEGRNPPSMRDGPYALLLTFWSAKTYILTSQNNGFEEPKHAASRIYAGGTAGRDRDHRRARGPAPARGASGAGVCASRAVRQQSPPDRHRDADLSRRTSSLSVRVSGRHRGCWPRFRHVRRTAGHGVGAGDRSVSGGGGCYGSLRCNGGRGCRRQSADRFTPADDVSVSVVDRNARPVRGPRWQRCGPRIGGGAWSQ